MPMTNLRREKRKKRSKTDFADICYRGINADRKMEFVEKVKKLTNEGLTKMVEHI